MVEKAGCPHFEVEYKEKTTIFSANDIGTLIYKTMRGKYGALRYAEMSPEVQNSNVSGPTKGVYVFQFYFEKVSSNRVDLAYYNQN